jgi:hypothetical protein
VPGPLRVEEVLGRPPCQRRHHDLGEQHRLAVGLCSSGSPSQVSRSVTPPCDGVPLAVRARSGLDAGDLDKAVPLELGQRAAGALD